jgi:hypothetical protein
VERIASFVEPELQVELCPQRRLQSGLLLQECATGPGTEGHVPERGEQREPALIFRDRPGREAFVGVDRGQGVVDSRLFQDAVGAVRGFLQQLERPSELLAGALALSEHTVNVPGEAIGPGRLEGDVRRVVRTGQEIPVEAQGVLQQLSSNRFEVRQVDQVLLTDADEHCLHRVHRASEV